MRGKLMANRLKNKTAIITGAGTGIGKAIARIFAAEGARVSVCGRTKQTLQETLAEIRKAGGEGIALPCDVSDSAQVERLVRQTVSAFGGLNVLVNNAGVRGSICTLEQLTEEEWQRTFDIDAKGSWLCSKAAIPEMRKSGGGSIIMVSSISAHIGQATQGCYNAAKAAQELLMKCMALDFAKDKIRVNSVCPAWVLTEMNRSQLAEMEANPDSVFPPGFRYKDVLAMHPIGRIGQPEDVAWAAVYLASEESSWVTGSSLMVDGGYTCQ
jgi:NAD(P)-dependent dehydrogenase (short-subunit alcohol dehydrogenase family)